MEDRSRKTEEKIGEVGSWKREARSWGKGRKTEDGGRRTEVGNGCHLYLHSWDQMVSLNNRNNEVEREKAENS